jgi:ubiquinone/menaquinone biosynthesis C-methylase UbiE
MTKMKEEYFEEWNERMVEKYDIEVYYSASNPVIRYIESRRIYWLLRLLSPRDNEKIFEVGCGAGHVLHGVGVGQLYGIDLSPRMLSQAKQRLGDKVELKKCNAEKIEYPDNCFDKTICTEVLEHTLHPARVIEEIARVSKPGGVVILSIPYENLINRIKAVFVATGIFKLLFKNIPKENEWHLHDFSLSTLRSITKGFMDEMEIRAVPNRFFPLRYVGKYKVLK